MTLFANRCVDNTFSAEFFILLNGSTFLVCGRVNVPHRHQNACVPQQSAKRWQICARGNGLRCKRVTQIVEAEMPLDFSSRRSRSVCFLDASDRFLDIMWRRK